MEPKKVRICKKCNKIEGEVGFYGRDRSKCKKCHNKECREYRERRTPQAHKGPGYWWYWDTEEEPRNFPKSLPGL